MTLEQYALWEMRVENGQELPTTTAPLGQVCVFRLDQAPRGRLKEKVPLGLQILDTEAIKVMRAWKRKRQPINIGLTRFGCWHSLEGASVGRSVTLSPEEVWFRVEVAGGIYDLPFDGAKEWPKILARKTYAYNVY